MALRKNSRRVFPDAANFRRVTRWAQVEGAYDTLIMKTEMLCEKMF